MLYIKNKTGPRSRVEVRTEYETLTLTAAKTTIIFKTQKNMKEKITIHQTTAQFSSRYFFTVTALSSRSNDVTSMR